MIKKILSILFVLLLLAIPGLGARGLIGTYNQTYADPNNGGANIWTTVNGTTGMYVWANEESQQYFIYNTTNGNGTTTTGVNLTLEAGPFIQGALGDLLYTLSSNQTYILGPFETSRFKQANETILLTFNASIGKIFCIGTE